MIGRRTKGRFLRPLSPKIGPRNQGLVPAHNRGPPRTAEKKILVQCAGACAPSPFSQLTTLTNEHQKSESRLTGM